MVYLNIVQCYRLVGSLYCRGSQRDLRITRLHFAARPLKVKKRQYLEDRNIKVVGSLHMAINCAILIVYKLSRNYGGDAKCIPLL